MLTMLFMNFSAILPNSGPLVGDDITEEIIGDIDPPQSSEVSLDPWWNGSYFYRVQINVTNPSPDDIVNQTVSIEFNYSALVNALPEAKMNADLSDIRIIENGLIRTYFVIKDHPGPDMATIWFKNNCSASVTETDTFMYYGNDTVTAGEAALYQYTQNPAGRLWYDFEEGSGTNIINKVEHDSNATATTDGGVTLPTYVDDGDLPGDPIPVGTYALDFDGNSDYAYINDLYYQSTTALPKITAMCWFKTAQVSGGDWDNWAFLDFDRSEYFNFFIAGTSGAIGFATSAQGGTGYDDFWSSTSGLNDDDWHFAAIVYDGINKYIYVDPEAGTHDVMGFGNNPHTGLIIGDSTRRYGFVGDGSEADVEDGARNDRWFDGQMDEVRYWEDALTATEIYNLYKGYVLTTTMNEEQEQKAEATFIILDIDGGIVPGAEVTIINGTAGAGVFNETKTASSDGSVVFTRLEYGEYNITVNYTLNSGLEQVIFNSSALFGAYNFTLAGLFHTFNLTTNIWTIDFEIVDWDNYPVNYGYINISTDAASPVVLESLPLDSNGKTTFRWISQASYFYKTYFSNDDYTPAVTPLNESIITRANYDGSERTYSQTIWVNQTDEVGGGGTYDVDQSFYAGGTQTTLLNKKILKANITLTDMDTTLTSITVNYIDADDSTYSGIANDHVIYSRTYISPVTDDFIELDMRMPDIDAVQLQADDYQVYGLKIEVLGANGSEICNGTIKVDTIETLNVLNTTALAKIHINVNDDTLYAPVPSAIIHVNTSAGTHLVDLVTDGSGDAYGQTNNDVEFWYLRDSAYNFTMEYFGAPFEFFVNNTSPEQWEPNEATKTKVSIYNYTLNQESTVNFTIVLNPGDYMTNFTEYYGPTNAIWGDLITYSVNFSYSIDAGVSWGPINASENVLMTILDSDETPVLSKKMTYVGDPEYGNFSLTFNSSELTAGSSSQYYTAEITGSEQGYDDPEKESHPLQVYAVQTDTGTHNYSNPTQGLNVTSQYYNELINVTVSYFINGTPNARLSGALLSYSWDYGSGDNIQEDPMNPGYYTFEFNTSTAPTTATYAIDIIMALENHTTDFITASVNILPRLTEINGTTKLKHISEDVWVKDAYNFTFEYNDTTGLNNFRVGDLETAVFNWYKLDSTGDPIGDPSEDIALDYDPVNKLYILDFDTENLTIGDYVFFITLQKNNYEARIAFVNLEIKLRTIDIDLTAIDINAAGDQISIVKGEDVVITIDLSDISKDNIDLLGATVTLTIEDVVYTFSEIGSGVYRLTYTTTDVNAFFMPVTLTGDITISKEDYVSQTLSITIVVGMDEIFPGMPLFYFLMIAGAIIAVVGSLVVSRAIRQARIPKFVKRVREMKSNIQSRKNISESLLYPSKNEYIVKKLGEKWEELGIDLGDILGIERTKGKKAAPGSKGPIEKPEGGVIE